MSGIVVDYLDSAGASDFDQLYSAANTIHGQSFTGIAGKITSCKFWLKKIGNPAGNVYAKLYAHSGVYGTSSEPIGEASGAALATSEAFAASSLPAYHAWVEFTFSGAEQYMMSATYYTIHIIYTGGDASNCILVRYVPPASAHSGNIFYGSVGTITPFGTGNGPFYVYKAEEEEVVNTMMMQQSFG